MLVSVGRVESYLVAEFSKSAGYIAGPVPRVMGEDVNSEGGGESECRYGQNSERGKHKSVFSGL